MIGARYSCGSERRRAAIAAPTTPPGLTGIDFLTVDQGPPLILMIELVKPVTLPAAVLNAIESRFQLALGQITR